MVLKTFETQNISEVEAELLTPAGFAPYGGVISADHQISTAKSSAANYGTATKVHKVAPIENAYDQCPSGKQATANWNIFRCKAPKHLISIKHDGSKAYLSQVLERHPYSTQTFVPMGQDLKKKSYLVIVAKTDESSHGRLPDPNTFRAFVCRGNQSVTYGRGTWHAPMVVIDEEVPHIDFAVFIHENGVPDEDVNECYFRPGVLIRYNTENHAAKL